LFATDNGPDNPAGPDELNYIIQGGDYGFPSYFGTPPNGSGTVGPVANLQLHSSSDGFTFYYGDKFPAEFVGNTFIAQWGANNSDPNVGERIVRVPITRTNHGFVGQEIVFATGFDHPLDVIDDHRGGLLVADHGAGTIYQISHSTQIQPTSTPSGTLRTTNSNVVTLTTLETFPVEFILLIVLVAFGIVVVLATRRAGKKA
jgi:glucose/arabinose dehydrogenase